jgi:orotate phosphoribosyltransferase-like protein
VIEGDVVTTIRTLAERGVGKKTIAGEVGVAVNTVRRYLRQPIAAGVQTRACRPGAERGASPDGA